MRCGLQFESIDVNSRLAVSRTVFLVLTSFHFITAYFLSASLNLYHECYLTVT
jgi:hypothetical protein